MGAKSRQAAEELFQKTEPQAAVSHTRQTSRCTLEFTAQVIFDLEVVKLWDLVAVSF